MNFEHDHHELTHHQVREFLDELFDSPYLDSDNGHFYVGYGSTVLEIAVEPYGPEETMIEVTAYCVQGVDLNEELAGQTAQALGDAAGLGDHRKDGAAVQWGPLQPPGNTRRR